MSDQEFIPRVFISYAWETPEHKAQVLAFADRLRADGVDARIDQYEEHQPDPWPRWMNQQIEAAHRVLMIFTPTYCARFEGADTPGGHGVNHEGLVIQQHLYNSKGKNRKFRAVLLGESTRDCLSVDVQPYTCYQPDDPLGYEDLVRWLYDVQRVTAAPLGKKPTFLDQSPPLGLAKVESVRGLSELYRRMRDQLIRQCQTIPVFGQVMEDIPMDKNFVKLRLSLSSGAVDGDRRAHGAFPRYDESRDLRQAGGKRRWGDDLADEPYRHRVGRLALEVPELWAHYPKAVILGLPGAGKTTILRHFVYLATRLREMPLVLFIACRSLRSAHFEVGDDPDGFKSAAAAFLYPSMGDAGVDETDLFHPAAGDVAVRHTWTPDQLREIDHLVRHIREAAGKNQLVLLVDAFDETLEPQRKLAETWLSALMRAIKVTADLLAGTPCNRCYFSARRHEIERFRSLDAPVFEVDPLNQDQMRDLARALFGEKSDTYQAFDAIVWREPVMQKMGRTPLTALLLLCYFDVHQRFDTRFHTYDLLLKFVLFNVWESIKRRSFTRDADRMRRWFIECADPDFEAQNAVVMMRYRALGRICHLLLYDSAESPGSGSREASENDLIRAFEEAIGKSGEARRKALEWLADFRKGNLLVATGPRTYVFVHSTLMEFLAAWHLCHVAEDERMESLERMCSLAFDSLDSLAIACGHTPDTNRWLFPLLEKHLVPIYYPSSTTMMHNGEETSESLSVPHSMQTLFRCVAEAESMEYGLIMSYTVRSHREAMVRELEPCVEARSTAYDHLRQQVMLADEITVRVWLSWLTGKPKEEILEILKQHSYTHIPDSQYLELGLSRGEVFPERYFGKWWRGDGTALSDSQTTLLCLMLKMDLRFQWYLAVESRLSRSVFAAQVSLSKPGTVPLRTLDQPGAPQDRDFDRYRGICGEELAGMLGSPNLRHGAAIHALAVHPRNPNWVFTAGNDHVIRLWDTEGGREIRSFAGHTGRVSCCALDAAGDRLISGSSDQTLKLWEVASGREIRSFAGHTGYVTCCALDATGELFISGSHDNTLILWELASGRKIRSFAGHSGYVTCCALEGAGERLISGSNDKTLKLWELADGREIRSFAGHTRGVTCCALDAAGGRLISGSDDNTLKLWDLASGREVRSFIGHTRAVTCCALDGGRGLLSSGSLDQTLRLWELASGREIRSFIGHTVYVTCCALDAAGERLISGAADKTLKLWELASGREIHSFAGHTSLVTCCALDASGERVISGSHDSTLKLWELASGREIRSFAGHTDWVRCCALDAAGERLISGSDDRTLKLWELDSGREIRSFAGHTDFVTCCALDARGEQLISGSSDQTLKLWELASGREIRSFVGHTNWVTCCALDTAGERLVSGSDDQTLTLWELDSCWEILTFAGHTERVTCCALDAAGERLISGSYDNTLKLWDLARGREIRSFAGHTRAVTCCALGAAGERIISGSYDQTLKLWDLNSGRELHSWNLPHHALSLALKPGPPELWSERPHDRPTQVLCVGLSNGVVLLFDLTEWL